MVYYGYDSTGRLTSEEWYGSEMVAPYAFLAAHEVFGAMGAGHLPADKRYTRYVMYPTGRWPERVRELEQNPDYRLRVHSKTQKKVSW